MRSQTPHLKVRTCDKCFRDVLVGCENTHWCSGLDLETRQKTRRQYENEPDYIGNITDNNGKYLSIRGFNALETAGCYTASFIVLFSVEELIRIRNCGRLTANEILKTCREFLTKAPMPVATPDWTRVRHMVLEMIRTVSEPNGRSKDFKDYLFEEVMKTMYGPKFFEWWNKGPGNREAI